MLSPLLAKPGRSARIAGRQVENSVVAARGRYRPEAVVRSSNNDELRVDLKAFVLGRIVVQAQPQSVLKPDLHGLLA